MNSLSPAGSFSRSHPGTFAGAVFPGAARASLLACLFLALAALSLQAQTAQRIYEFNGSYAETNGGAAMVPNGGTLGASGYTFAESQGPAVSNALANAGEYSIEMVFRIDSVSGYRSLLNFNNLSADNAIYCRDGGVLFYSYSSAAASTTDLAPGQTHRLVVTRSATTRVTTAYVDGVQRAQVTDTNDYYVASAANGILHFFRDNGTEHPTGFVDQIRIYHSVLTSAQVSALGGAATPWQSAVTAGNPAATYFTPVAGASPVPVNVGTFAAGSARSFEFVFTAAGAGPSKTLLGSQAASSGAQYLKLHQFNNTGRFGLTTAGVADYVFNNSPTLSNQRVHAVFVSNGSVTTLYLNGVAQSGTVNEGLKITGRNGLGAVERTTQLAFEDNLDGTITGFASYARALTQAEVTTRYNALAGIVPNATPVVAVNAPASISTAEGTAPAKTGTFSDANGNATVTLTASAGTITQNNAAGTWSWTGPIADGPASSTITITATDTASAVATATFTWTITNVAPAVVISAPASANEDAAVSFSFTATDPSTADQSAGFAWSINYGDGSPVQNIPAGTASPLARTYTYANPGSYTVTATATDKNAGVSAAATRAITINVVNAPPEINLVGNGTPIPDGDQVPTSGKHTRFGSVATSLVRTFTIENTGTGPLTIASITVTGDNASEFAISGAPASVAAGTSATFNVTFTPTAGVATSRATVTVNNNDANEAAYDFVVEGEKTYPFAAATWLARDAAAANAWSAVAYGNGLFVAVSGSGTQRVMTSPDGFIWTARTVPDANAWSSITYGRNLFVAVSANGTNQVMTSPDGITWTARAFSLALGFRSITYGNGRFVGVGTNGIASSPDGITWTSHASPSTNQLYSVAYGNGLFAAVSIDGTSRIITSPDGITWTSRTAPAASPWSAITYGQGRFVAVAYSGTERVMTSSDGLAWTAPASTAGGALAGGWFSVSYGSGLFVAVSNSAGPVPVTMTSPDGLTWTAADAVAASNWNSLTYGNGRFVAVANSGVQRVMVLKTLFPEIGVLGNGTAILDGDQIPATADHTRFGGVATSLARTFTIANSGSDPLFISSITVTGENASEFAVSGAPTSVPAGSSETFTLTYTPTSGVSTSRATLTINSNDADEAAYDFEIEGEKTYPFAGAVWTPRNPAASQNWQGLAHGNGVFVAVANYTVTGGGQVMTSPDGSTWTLREAAVSSNWQSVTFGKGLFVAVSRDGASQVMTSPDGITWTARPFALPFGFRSVVYGNGRFVGVGIDAAATSPDGITWTPRTPTPSSNDWGSVAYGNGLFVAVSRNGTQPSRIMTSPDGVTWTARTTPAANSWSSVAYGNGLFVAVSWDGTQRVMTSPDGIAWTARSASDNHRWFSVAYGNGLFLAVADGGAQPTMTSPDGITWTGLSAQSNDWTRVAYGGGRFVALAVGGDTRAMTLAPAAPEIQVRGNGNVIQDGDFTPSVTKLSRFGPVATSLARNFLIENSGTDPLGIFSITITGEHASEFSILFAPDAILPGGAREFRVVYTPTLGVPTSRATITINNGDANESAYDFVVEGEKAYPASGTQWTSRTAVGGTVWRRVTYGNGLFVAVGDTAGPWIMTSPDGTTWTARTPPTGDNWSAVTYGNGLFVAVAYNSANIATSPDGITWTLRTAPSASGWGAITHGNGAYVAVAFTGTHRVMRSVDGITWTAQTPSETKGWLDVTWGNGLFVAVANSGSGNDAMTSPDGITWTARDGGGSAITYGNGRFVTVQALSAQTRTSVDGIAWTSTFTAQSNLWNAITYGNGLFVAVSSNGTDRVMTSPDGTTWTARAAAHANTWFGVAYGQGRFVAVSGNGANRVMTSSPDLAAVVTGWAAGQGLSGPAALPAAQPFGDGVPNLLKYAFNMPLDGPRANALDPAAGPGANGLPVFTPQLSGPTPTLRAQFLRRKNSGLNYVPQRSASLTDPFIPMLAPQVVTPIDSDWELVTVDEPLGLPLPPTFFSRVHVTLP